MSSRFAASLIAATLGLTALAVQAAPATYKIDDDHTYATFAISHFGASVNRARFDKADGTIEFDKVARKGKIDVTVDVKSIASGSAEFDKHLQAPDLFNAEKFPTLRFVSDRLVYKGGKLTEVPGQLTLLGQTHPVTLKVKQFACYDNPMAKTEACGGDFEAVIDRSQWGMNFGADFGITKKVTIGATIEAFKQ
ncbi:polyisoprenoid-binding protein [Ottowia sp. GY511]|uniref:YceI family protein n=1 Tax=Ottowia flava TaxID=2675430 RepID=A0ABW4KPN5_9BURK|nr:YceI family protein [Ottowia sp. GY511]TXK32842.1 polyisoprenoid-binding protein [Ottowia sp. GY511]